MEASKDASKAGRQGTLQSLGRMPRCRVNAWDMAGRLLWLAAAATPEAWVRGNFHIVLGSCPNGTVGPDLASPQARPKPTLDARFFPNRPPQRFVRVKLHPSWGLARFLAALVVPSLDETASRRAVQQGKERTTQSGRREREGEKKICQICSSPWGSLGRAQAAWLSQWQDGGRTHSSGPWMDRLRRQITNQHHAARLSASRKPPSDTDSGGWLTRRAQYHL